MGPALAVAAVLMLLVGAGSAKAATAVCPNTFHVLHDDRVGKLKLPKGHYKITLLRKNKLSCARAAKLFTKFLEDYDGKLPGKWRVVKKSASFVKGNTGIGFSVKKGRKRGGGGGRHPSGGGKRCRATFEVLHNDRIGKLKIPAGEYYITRLTRTSPNCKRASKLFAKFLDDVNGDLPRGWRLNVRRGAVIKRGTGGDGFRIKPA
jgi:hypothetical protein